MRGRTCWPAGGRGTPSSLESRQIAACSDDSASAKVDGVGTSLAGAVGRSASGGGNIVLAEGLIERLAGGNPLRQSGMGHQAHVAGRLPHRSGFASDATKHVDIRLVS